MVLRDVVFHSSVYGYRCFGETCYVFRKKWLSPFFFDSCSCFPTEKTSIFGVTVSRRIKLKWILKKGDWNAMAWSRPMWLRIGISSKLLWTQQWVFRSHRILWNLLTNWEPTSFSRGAVLQNIGSHAARVVFFLLYSMFPWNISSCIPSNMALRPRRLWRPLSLPLKPWMFYKIYSFHSAWSCL